MALIEIKNLDFAYNGEAVLKDVNLAIRQKDFVAIIGPNGGGKTTLLKLMLGLLKPLQGTINVNGKSPRKASSCIGYVPQDVHMNRSFPITVIDVVLMGKLDPKKHWSRRSAANRRDAMAALERMGMVAYADKKIGELSEPTASIDTKGQADLYQLLKELNQDITVVVVSHDLLVISRFVKSVACVNKSLHYHDQAEITGDMLGKMYLCSVEEVCPVELVGHGLSHRVPAQHEKHLR